MDLGLRLTLSLDLETYQSTEALRYARTYYGNEKPRLDESNLDYLHLYQGQR